MAKLSEKKTKTQEYAVWVLKKTNVKAKYPYLKGNGTAGTSYGQLNSSLRFATKNSALSYAKSWAIKGLRPKRVWATKQAFSRVIWWG